MKAIPNIEKFRQMLDQQKKSYLLDSSLPASQVSLQFEGPFDNKNIVWQASIMTMQEYAKTSKVSNDPAQIIDIAIIDGVYHLKIVLNVKQIDRVVIEGSIIMIRKYKRLRLGRHQYGVRSKTE